MTNEKDENGNLLSDDIRLTKFGKWLRNSSLDEMPEAINILKQYHAMDHFHLHLLIKNFLTIIELLP